MAQRPPSRRRTPRRRTAYPVIERLLGAKSASVFELLRPFTLLAPLIGGTSAAIIASVVIMGPLPALELRSTFPFLQYREDFPALTDIIFGVSTLVLINAASNSINQVYDLAIDRVNKPARPIPSGRVGRGEARTLAVVLYLVTLWRATLFRSSFGFFVLILILLTCLYSAPPARLKRRFVVNNLVIAASRGLIGFLAAWSIIDKDFLSPASIGAHMEPWAMGITMSVFLAGAITTKDFTDVPGDKRYGMRTLPVVLGVRAASFLTAPFFLVPASFIFLFVQVGWLIPAMWYLVPVLLIWGALATYQTVRHATDSSAVVENNPAWVHMYFLLFVMQSGFLIIYLLHAPLPTQ